MDSKQDLTGYVLSSAQKRIWEFQKNGRRHLLHAVIDISGPINSQSLRESLQKVVDRHEILRTTFEHHEAMSVPLQVVHDSSRVELEILDFRVLSEAEQRAKLAELIGNAEQQDASPRGTLLDVKLVKLSDQESVLLISLPALNADRQSLANIFVELCDFYIPGSDDGSRSAPVQYVDYSEWLRSIRKTDGAEAGKTFWHNRIPGNSRFVFDSESLADANAEPIVTKLTVPSGVSDNLLSLAKKHELSIAELMAACSHLWWRRITGISDVFSWFMSSRKFVELKEAVGPFSERLPVTVAVDSSTPFSTYLKEFAWTIREVAKWQEFYEPADVPVSTGTGVELIFEFEQRAASRRVDDVEFRLRSVLSTCESLVINLVGVFNGHDLSIEVVSHPASVSRATSERIMGQIAAMLESIAEDPQRPIDEIIILGNAEQQLLHSFNDNFGEVECGRLLHRLIEEAAVKFPEATAVVANGRTLNYAQLNARANQLAHKLQELGVGPDRLVGICVERSPEMIVAILSVLKAGGAYVPLDPGTLNPGRTGFPQARLRFMLEDTGIKVLLTQRDLVPFLRQHSLSLVLLDSSWDQLSSYSTANPISPVSARNLAYAIYTSGSTGRPKAVMVEHKSVLNLLESLAKNIYDIYGPSEGGPLRLSLNAPMGFDPSVQQLVMLTRGHALYVVPEDSRSNGRAMLDFLSQNAIDVLDCTPSQLRLLIAEGMLSDSGRIPALILVGGEPIDASMWRKLAETKRTRAINVYGPTECTVDVTFSPILNPSSIPTIGRPMLRTQIYVLDRKLQQVPIGSVGEIYIGGASLARGYLNNEGLTSERFIGNPFDKSGSRLYCTGDLGRYLPDGQLVLVGRADHQVKLRSHRIELGEVENVLGQHPAVSSAVAVVHEPKSGEPRLVAYVVPRLGRSPTFDELRVHLKEWLPEYMLPSTFVFLDQFPLTSSGKVDRGKLPAPGRTRPKLENQFVAPRTDWEQRVAAVWSEVLQIDEVGVFDDFFTLGGHSLLAVGLYEQIEAMSGKILPPEMFFRVQTVEQQAAVLSALAE